MPMRIADAGEFLCRTYEHCSSLYCRPSKSYTSPHGHLQLLSINGAGAISVKQVKGLPAMAVAIFRENTKHYRTSATILTCLMECHTCCCLQQCTQKDMTLLQ